MDTRSDPDLKGIGVKGIGDRLEAVRRQIDAACAAADRDPAEVVLVAVSKGHSPAAIRAAYEAGCREFGESYVQEAADKIPWLPDDIRWHMVGHLQRNKAAEAVSLFHVLHAVDSTRLIRTVSDRLPAAESRQSAEVDPSGVFHPAGEAGHGSEGLPILVQVNVSGEEAKYGVAPEEAGQLVKAASQAAGITPVGLMALPPYSPDPEASRPVFKALRRLRNQLEDASGIPLRHLSMGMSGDYVVAVEEGATLLRVGTAIFGPRD